MAKMYYAKDCDINYLNGKKIAIIGYGSQGHAHALNLKDSGCDVCVGLRAGSKNWSVAEKDGLKVMTVPEAAKWGDIVMMLINDEVQADVYKRDIAPNLEDGNALAFAHGFNIRYQQIVPPKGVDVFMAAPKGPGHTVRSTYVNGKGVPCLIAVEQNATGDAYQYGLFFSDTREVEGDESGKVSYVRTLRFESPEGTTSFSNVGYIGDNGVPGGIAVDGDGKLRSRVTLEAVEGVSRSDFFVSNGASYVNAGGKVYQVSNKVACYNTTTKVWFTGDDPLYQIRAYSDDLTIYVDPYGEKVRVITTQ